MVAKYRFKYEDHERLYLNEKGKCEGKSEMLWEFERTIVGITDTGSHYEINHYNKNFDKSEYVKVEMDYTLKQYGRDWFDKVLEDLDKEENNV